MPNPGKELAKLRKTETKTCPVCGLVFVARLTAIYHSAKCRRIAWVRNHSNTQTQEEKE